MSPVLRTSCKTGLTISKSFVRAKSVPVRKPKAKKRLSHSGTNAHLFRGIPMNNEPTTYTAAELMPSFKHCVECKQPFVWKVNVFTMDGAAETKISGLCEKCFDAMFEEH